MSDTHSRLAAMLASIQPLGFDKVNPHFNNGYVSEAALLGYLKNHVNGFGFYLSAVTEIEDFGGVPQEFMTFRLTDTETTEIVLESSTPLTSGQKPQAYGSERTYKTRYVLKSMFFIPMKDETDDDGESGNTPPKVAKPSTQKPSVPTGVFNGEVPTSVFNLDPYTENLVFDDEFDF